MVSIENGFFYSALKDKKHINGTYKQLFCGAVFFILIIFGYGRVHHNSG